MSDDAESQIFPPTAEPEEPVREDGEAANQIAITVARIVSAPTLAEKSDVLFSLPPEARHEALANLPAPVVAAIIEGDPERNIALIANLPSTKFVQVVNLGTFEQGRHWLERAVSSGSLAGSILPSLLTANELANMLLTAPDVRRSLHKLLNFERAQRWRQLLTVSEWHHNIDELLMADAPELLAKAPFRDKAVRAVLSSLLDFVPELYLETINLALERAKNTEDRPDEYAELVSEPFGLPEITTENGRQAAAETTAPAPSPSPLTELMPEGGDPIFALASIGLSASRKALLEDQLKTLLRQEIVAAGSFAQEDMQRAAGRVLFSLRAGLLAFGPSIEDATHTLETRPLTEISAIGARKAEEFRQRALGLMGLRDWLDGRQRQFLDAMRQPEAGIDPMSREPVFFLAGKQKQDRSEWHPTPLSEITQRLSDIAAWGPLARAAFGLPERVHAIFANAKTRTYDEALRRTVIALALYRRWEPELVRPAEDFPAFQRQYPASKSGGLDPVRQIVLDALDSTPDAAWKPSDAKKRARDLLLRAIDELERKPVAGHNGHHH